MKTKFLFALLSILFVPLGLSAQNVTVRPDNGSVLPCKKDGGGDSFFVYGGSSSWTHEQLPLTLVTGDSDNNLTNSGNQLTRSGQLANVANDIFVGEGVTYNYYITYVYRGTTYYLNILNNDQLRFTTNKTTTWEVDDDGYVHSGDSYLVCNQTGTPSTLSIGNSDSQRRLQKDNNGRLYYDYQTSYWNTDRYYLQGTTNANQAPSMTYYTNNAAVWTEETVATGTKYLQIGKGNNMDTYMTIGLPSGYRLTGYTITFKRVNQVGNKGLSTTSNTTISFGETNNTFSDYAYGSGTYQNGINYNNSSGNYSQYTISRTSQSDTDMGNVLYFKLSNNKSSGRAFIQLDYVELRFTAEYNYPPLTPGNPVYGQSAVDISFTTGKMDFGNLSLQEDGNDQYGYDERISYNGRLHDLTGNLTLYEYGSVTADQDNNFDGTVGKMVDYIDGSITSAGEYFKLDVSEHNHMKLDERQNISASEKQDTAIYFIESPVWLVNGASSSQHKNPVGYRIVKASFDCATTTNAPTQFKIQFHDYDDGWEGGSDYGLNYYSGQYNYNYQTIWSIDSEGYIYYSIYYLSVVNDNLVIVTEKPTAANGTFEIYNNQIRRKNNTSQYIGWEKTTISGVTNRAAVITTTTNNRATYNQVSAAHTENVGNYTFLIYDKTGKYVAKEVPVTGNTTLSIDSLNNDAVKIGVIGSGLIKGNLTLQALDPYIERLSIVCQENSGNSGGRVSQQFNAKDFSVKGGTFLFQVPSDFRGDAKFTFENLYSNYGDNTYYDETSSTNHARYYFVGSTYGNYDNNDVYARYKNHSDADYTTKVACSNPGNIKYIFNNADTVVNDGGYYKQFPFTLAKYAAKGGNFTPFIFPRTSMNNTATKTAYLFTADETRYNIAPTTGTQHVSYAYYEMTIKMDMIDYYPYLTWTKIYNETFGAANNDSKWGLTITTTKNSQNTELGTHSGYLTVSSILDYINGRATSGTVGSDGYIPLGSANAPSRMDQILYIDASQLESIMENQTTTTGSTTYTNRTISELQDSLDVNALIYLPYGSQSQLDNVAFNMTAKYTEAKSFHGANNIVITDKYPFFAPYAIQVDAAKYATYTRQVTVEKNGKVANASVMLPFTLELEGGVHTNPADVPGGGQEFTVNKLGSSTVAIVKDNTDASHPFNHGIAYFKALEESSSEANKPYMINVTSAPAPAEGQISFIASQKGSLIVPTPKQDGTDGYTHTGELLAGDTFDGMTFADKHGGQTLNFTNYGSYSGAQFQRINNNIFYFANNQYLSMQELLPNLLLNMYPFRGIFAYTLTGTNPNYSLNRFDVSYEEPDFEDVTGINDRSKNPDLMIRTDRGSMIITATEAQEVTIYSVSGACIAKVNMQSGDTQTVNLPTGVYLVNDVKIAVK